MGSSLILYTCFHASAPCKSNLLLFLKHERIAVYILTVPLYICAGFQRVHHNDTTEIYFKVLKCWWWRCRGYTAHWLFWFNFISLHTVLFFRCWKIVCFYLINFGLTVLTQLKRSKHSLQMVMIIDRITPTSKVWALVNPRLWQYSST